MSVALIALILLTAPCKLAKFAVSALLLSLMAILWTWAVALRAAASTANAPLTDKPNPLVIFATSNSY